MNYTSLKELYKSVIPAFNVKKRLLKYSKNSQITNEIMWDYLANTKWKMANNLTISDIVNDIINLDVDNIK